MTLNNIASFFFFIYTEDKEIPPPDPDYCDDFVSLPDFGESPVNNNYFGNEYNSDSSELVPCDAPFYANQEEDPDVQNLIFRENMQME